MYVRNYVHVYHIIDTYDIRTTVPVCSMTNSNFYYFKESGERAWCVWTLKERMERPKMC